MKRKLIRIIRSIILLMTFLASTVLADTAIPNATNKFVNDFANVISDEVESIMYERSNVLYQTYPEKVQVMVATIESLNGIEISEYALSMYNTYGIGLKDVNQGALILVSINDRKTWITTGSGTDDYYITDERASELAAIGNTYFKAGDYSSGLMAIQFSVIEEFNLKMNIEASNNSTVGANTMPNNTNVSDNATTVFRENNSYNSVRMYSGEEVLAILNKELYKLQISKFFWIVGLGIIIIVLSVLYRKQKLEAKKAKESFEKELKECQEDFARRLGGYRENSIIRMQEKKKIDSEYNELHEQYMELYNRFEMAKRIDPQIETKVSRTIAESWDRRVRCVLDASSSYDDKLKESQKLIAEYDGFNTEVKSFATLVFDLRKHIKDSIDERDRTVAKEVEEKIREALERKGYFWLKSAKREYDGVTEDVKSFMDAELISEFFLAFKAAERLENALEQERRRKSSKSLNRSYNTFGGYSSSDSNSSYSSDSSSYDTSSSTFDTGDGGASDGGGGGADW